MQTANDIVINVQEIEPRLRHQTIFYVFDNLQEGESFVIHNNHDPRPVYFQLMDMHGDIFTWEYLQQGPEWWDIKVTRKVLSSQPANENNSKENVINVPSLEPRLKHATIFGTFDNLKPGESFIIHNDHDPKPVYFQLMSMHGDVFTWEYLQQGPQWWDIRVTRKGQAQPAANDAVTKQGKDIVINVPALEPRLKHPTIFKVFDSLKPGESLVIHNDHDPKPLYYQLQGERGDVFTWEYLQQGPQWWDIRVTRKGTETHETIGEIVAKDLRKSEVFKKYGIDFCCNGKKTIREACAAMGIDPATVEQELQKPVQGVATSGSGAMNYDEWGLDFLSDYIVNTHHRYIRKYLPEITGYANKVAHVHGANHPELLRINELVHELSKELPDHIGSEENKLFPVIKEIVKAKESNTAYNRSGSESFRALVAESEKEHDSVGDAMKEIRKLSKDYAIPGDACTSYKLLYKMLEEFENDLFVHIHLENNILFPKAVEAEKTLA
ncbi:MAG: iron-sulfur cluster repair di-iron protein [Chitinophagaceae bacterium]|nr:iron-sulfur cluster repair di-iron protein [Chitinophagaceae bacterium]